MLSPRFETMGPVRNERVDLMGKDDHQIIRNENHESISFGQIARFEIRTAVVWTLGWDESQ